MREEKKSVNVRTCGLSTLLTVAFVVLKLCHVIEWSWLWVLAPLWIPIVLWLLIIGFILIFTGIIDR